MVRKKISQTIQELLLEHNYIVIPQFGGFVSKYQAARVITEKNIILPPNKEISFNAELKNDDGLLINAFSTQEKISIKDAEKQVKTFVQKAFTSLDDGKSIKFDKIGILKYNQNLKIEFEANNQENYNPDSYGMVSVSCQILTDSEIVEKKNKSIFTRKNFIRAAVILPFFIIGTILSIYLNQIGLFSNSGQEQASVISFSSEKPVEDNIVDKGTISEAIDIKTDKKNALAYTEPVKETEQASVVEENQIEPLLIEEEVVSDVKIEEKEEAPTPIVKENLDLRYQLVAGSFKSKANAKRLIKKLAKKIRKTDFHPEVVKNGTQYRVVANSYASKSDAVKAKKSLKAKKISSWVNTLK